MPSLFDMNPVPVVEVEITSDAILTDLAIALGVDITNAESTTASFKSAKTSYKTPPGAFCLQDFQTYDLKIRPMITHPQSYYSSITVESISKKLQELISNGLAINSNYISFLEMEKVNLSSYKPVTLETTGKTKPSTLTMETPKKSSPSSILKKNSDLFTVNYTASPNLAGLNQIFTSATVNPQTVDW